MMSKHLVFREVVDFANQRKTNIYSIQSKFDNTVLGEVRWHGRWRQYCFFPRDDCVWSHDCLQDLHDFIIEKNLEHKKYKRDSNGL